MIDTMVAVGHRPDQETTRLAALEQYAILDTPPEPGFDDIVLLATRLCRTPVALVSLVAGDRQWFKARVGFSLCETPLAQSVCTHALRQPGLLVIPDLTRDPRTKDNTLVTGEPHLRFYAGVRLETSDGVSIGTLCVLDTKPRLKGLTHSQAEELEVLARQVMRQLELRQAIARRDEAVRSLAQAERRLVREREHLAQMFAQAPGFMAMLREPAHLIEMANAAYMQVFGRHEVLGRALREAFPNLEGQGLFEILDRVYATGEPHVGRAVRFVLQPSPSLPPEERFIDFVFQPVTDADGAVGGIFIQGSDVTRQVINERMLDQARQDAEEAAQHATTLALTDPLTGLANRRKMMQSLDDAVAHARNKDAAFSVILVDVDHFKRINDVWGHAVGDEVLRRVAQSASGVVDEDGLVGRIGGEEFLILLPNADQAVAEAIAECVRAAILAEGGNSHLEPTVSASFGVASLRGRETGDKIMKRADEALYAAKQAGRNTVRRAA